MVNRAEMRGVLGSVITGWLLVGCSPTSPDEREFIILVDSIVVPETVSPQDNIPVRMLGTIGPSSCFQFTHFLVDLGRAQVRITVMGREVLNTGCFGAIAELDRVFLVAPPFDDPFLVEVKRSRKEVLQKTVRVLSSGQH